MKRLWSSVCLILMMMASAALAEAPLSFCVNEVCADNGGSFIREGKTPDYIELKNLTAEDLSLNGYFLSRDEDHPDQFSLNGYVLPAQAHIILAADKKELPFKLSASEETELYLSDADGTVLQHVTLPPLEKDTTYSRQEDGAWHITPPTPMAENASGEPYAPKVYVASPRFSHPAGFYDEPFELTITGYRTDTVYYTTDGSAPDENAIPCTGSIRIEDISNNPNYLSARTDVTIADAAAPTEPVRKATVIRAVAIDPDGHRSKEAVNTYFVGFGDAEAFRKFSVISIIADPDSLFDGEKGIYVRGKAYADWLADEARDTALAVQRIPANYRMRGREWEIPVTIQWFDAPSALRMSQTAGLRIHGNWSRERAKKSFNLYARKEYGNGSFTYNPLPGNASKERLVLRANLGKDTLLHAMLAETGLMTSPCTPCMAFVNGEFWGFYEMREKQDERDIADFYGLNEDELTVIKNGELSAGELPKEAKTKDGYTFYKDLTETIAALNPATDAGYAAVGEMIDIDNYITYMAGIAYLNDSDYGSNYTIWRSTEKKAGTYRDGKWRWIFQDLDNCCFTFRNAAEIISMLAEDRLFQSLWQNPDFQAAFLTRIMDYANVELPADYVLDFITPILTAYDPCLIEDSMRYPTGNKPDGEPGRTEINALDTFFRSRREKTIAALKTFLGVTRETAALTVTASSPDSAFTVNGHPAHISNGSWTGVYYTGSSLTIRAKEIPGHRFTGWYEGEKRVTDGAALTVNLDADRMLTPMYEALPVAVRMDRENPLRSTDDSGYSRKMEGSPRFCQLRPDETLRPEGGHTDGSLTFAPDPSAEKTPGLTLSLPLYDYTGTEGSFTLETGSPLTWRVLCGNNETRYREQPAETAILSDGTLRVSYAIPEELLNAEQVYIRLEAVTQAEDARFTLRGFRVYGVPLDAPISRARAYALTARRIGAPEAFIPDPEQMEEMSAAEIDAVILAARDALQTRLVQEALTTAEKLGPGYPALEGVTDRPVIVIDDRLIDAFYDQDRIRVGVGIRGTVYLYEWMEERLTARGTYISADGAVALHKQEGTFLMLDQPLEDLRFRAAFSAEAIPQKLLQHALMGEKPCRSLWLDIETLTSWQEEAAIQLPSEWRDRAAFVYRAAEDTLIYAAEKRESESTLRITPETGKYLLTDETVEAIVQRAEWDRMQTEDIRREKAEKAEKEAHISSMIMSGSCALLLAAAGILAAFLRKKSRQKA